MTEFFKEFFHTVNERIRNKIFGRFIIAFFTWNWEPLLMILASKNRIEFTINSIQVSGLFNFYNVLAIPLLISLIYSISASYLTNGIDWINKKSLKWKINNKYDHKDLDITKKLDLGRKEYEYQEILSGNATLAELNSKIQTLTENQEKLISENNELRNEATKNIELKTDINNLNRTNSNLKELHDQERALLENVRNNFIHSGLEVLNYQLQEGNFELVGIPNSMIQFLLNLKMIEKVEINGKTIFKFSDNGLLEYLKNKNEY